ncbi:hypothetical protein [Amycolatopsis rhizosphaerae]|uniref:hypothetical protein n=1 Tax=Amycolatopsis rhizosphaerae TaxID=2053003 RepID=UPI001643ABAB|nr:hypothetical protein [Amycolatopsis rhizosphaerae]
MTYPPQPGQPGSGPHWGGFPQQPMPPGAPGHGPYYGAQNGPQYDARPPGSGGRKGLWIALSVALVVVLAAVGITGFWQPGFFLGGKSGGGAQAAATSPSPTPSLPAGSPSATSSSRPKFPSKDEIIAKVQAFLDKLNAGDGDGAKAMLCTEGFHAQPREETRSVVDKAAQPGTRLTIKGAHAADGVGVVELDGTVAGKAIQKDGEVATQLVNGQECVADIFYY